MPNVTVFVRDQGPICYVTTLFHNPMPLRTILPDELLSSGLSWLWLSTRSQPDELGSDYALPATRSATQLTRHNSQLFLDDMLEQDSHGYGRFIAVFGVETDSVSTLTDESKLHEALQEFSQHESTPIHIVVVTLGDTPREYIFVPHRLTELTKALLERWGVDDNVHYKTRPYKQLYLARLESIFNLEPDESATN